MTSADPTIRAHLENLRLFISRFRRSRICLLLSVVIVFPITVVLSGTTSLSATTLDYMFYVPFCAAVAALFYYDFRFPKQFIHCPSCSRVHLSQEWVCGECHKTNKHVKWPTRKTFVEACRFSDCKKVPHSLICPKCREPILFTDGANPKTSAWLPGYPPLPPEPETPAVAEYRPPKLVDEHLH